MFGAHTRHAHIRFVSHFQGSFMCRHARPLHTLHTLHTLHPDVLVNDSGERPILVNDQREHPSSSTPLILVNDQREHPSSSSPLILVNDQREHPSSSPPVYVSQYPSFSTCVTDVVSTYVTDVVSTCVTDITYVTDVNCHAISNSVGSGDCISWTAVGPVVESGGGQRSVGRSSSVRKRARAARAEVELRRNW